MVISCAENVPTPAQHTSFLSGYLDVSRPRPVMAAKDWSQPVNQAQDLGEQRSWDGDPRQLERDIATVPRQRLLDRLAAMIDPNFRNQRRMVS